MVNVFIIHSGSDRGYVMDTVIPYLLKNLNGEKRCHTNVLIASGNPAEDEVYKKKCDNPDCFVAEKTGRDWKRDVRKRIRKANAVLVVWGRDTAQKASSVGWEIAFAKKCNKLVLIHKTEEDLTEQDVPDFLKTKDTFTGRERLLAKAQTLEDIRRRIDNYDNGYYDIFSAEKYRENHDNEIGKIMEQYKMYQKTSEDLVTRRQNVSSFYISVNGAIVAVSGVILGLVEAPTNILVILLMAVVGMVLDFSWIRILEAYGMLNSAKMKVIRMLEKELPISLYDSEWNVMSDKLNQKKYVSFTDSEKRIPILFLIIYSLIIIGMLVYCFVR